LINYILCSILLFTNFSCHHKIEESSAQKDFLNITKDFNKKANLNSDNKKIIEEIKVKYAQKITSIKIVSNWRGKITLLDLDEVEQYSKDTVVMRIGIENTYDTGYQDYFSFVEVMPISKKSKLFDMLNKIEKNSTVIFSGELRSANLNDLGEPKYLFSNFNIATSFSDIEELK